MQKAIELIEELKSLRLKHLPGEHDQSTHAGSRRKRYGKDLPAPLYDLARSSLQYDSFDSFRKGYSWHNYYGQYWHITSDPNFQLNRNQEPTDLSSMSAGRGTSGGEFGFQVSTDIDNWDAVLNPDKKNRLRPYAVEVDLSRGKPEVDYRDTTRGFGHEMYILNPDIVKIKRVVPIAKAKRIQNEYFKKYLPNSNEELKEIYDWARANRNKLKD